MQETNSEPKTSRSGRSRLVVGAATIVVAIGAVIWAVSAGASSDSQVDDAEVCDTTEYEGCPQRWEYLWADEDQ